MIAESLLQKYDSVNLEEMSRVKLMNRVDTKFVVPLPVVTALLEWGADRYLMQEIEGKRNMPYFTRYFDTPDNRMYYEHERGKKNRRKIRIRRYEGTVGPAFLEIKDKNNKGRTSKKRVGLEEGLPLAAYADFIAENSEYREENLQPKIENRFNRLTLANPDWTERITIDTDLCFHNPVTEKDLSLQPVGIIEWKRDALAARSELAYRLHELRVSPGRFSKYIMGMALTDQTLRRNRIKPRIRNLEKIIRQY